MRYTTLFTVLTCISSIAYSEDTIGSDLLNLAKLKLWSEVNGFYPNRERVVDSRKNPRKDSINKEYSQLIAKVKRSPKLYLSYINSVLKQNTGSLRKELVPYKNTTVTPLFVYSTYTIKVIDLYRVTKYSLFERNDDFLPEDFHNLGVIDPKNYYGYYEPEPKRKAAIWYIISKFSLTTEERKFLKNKLNVGFVMDIKKFLDTSANTVENNEFIRSSITTFTKTREMPLAGLYFYRQLSKDTKNYIPRDREPKNQR